MPFSKDIWGRYLTALADTTCKSAMFSVPEWQGQMQAGAGHGNKRWFPSPLPGPSFTPASGPAVVCSVVDLLLSTLLTGRNQLLAGRVAAISPAKGEALLVPVSSCTGRPSTALSRSCNMKKILCCDERVTLKEQGAGISSLISCQCHQGARATFQSVGETEQPEIFPACS